MDTYDHSENAGRDNYGPPEPEIVPVEAIPEPGERELYAARRIRRRVWVPLGLFVATWLSTLLVGGWTYAVPLMTILICHEMGHFLQARRYGVYATYPYFIPVPFGPIGTFGAVIAMAARMGHRRALFDIGITGPLAGLVPTVIFCVVGLRWSHVAVLPKDGSALLLGEPLLFTWLARYMFGALPAGYDIVLHPMAYAGWVGLLITAINLFPIGQLDGGHILYTLLRGHAHRVASVVLLAAAAAVVVFQLWGWMVMLLLLLFIGPAHPPTADDEEPLGAGRILLGWLTLAFIPIGLTPIPFLIGR